MQRVKQDFQVPTRKRHGSLQSCIRTDDIDLVGDGSHLTSFRMIGNFSFGGRDYDVSIELWHSILQDLGIKDCCVKVHPSQLHHRELWQNLGYEVQLESQCVWSDGEIGGYCCELFVGDLEIGNLVNPLGDSTDVGFGWERLHQVVEETTRIDQTSLFDRSLDPVISDHQRTVSLMWDHGICPGNKGRGYVCRRLIRRLMRRLSGSESFVFQPWIETERQLRESSLRQGKRVWKRHRNKPPSFWWETFGVLPDEIELLQ